MASRREGRTLANRRRLGAGYLAAAQDLDVPEPDEHARLLPAERIAEPESEGEPATPAVSAGRRRLGPGYLATVQDFGAPA
ncbi:hypothetical protein [Kitasatospora griseola]|uniref:hypothetical protein n=1 Tax=Kitasatospora griseola TaxID=2064 RepID=UPI00381346EF